MEYFDNLDCNEVIFGILFWVIRGGSKSAVTPVLEGEFGS